MRCLDFSRSKFSAQTYLEKRTVFKKFFEHFKKDSAASQLRPLAVLSFLQHQKDKRSGYAANKTRKNLVAAWNWGIKYLEFHKDNPCLVDRFPEQRQIRYVPPESDFWKVCEAAWTAEDKLMLLSYMHLAARKSELFRLKWEDIDFAESKVRLFTRKTKDGSWEGAWLPLTDDLHSGLMQLKRNRLSDILVFPDPETRQAYSKRLHWMNNLCKRAGVKHFGLHAIRHLTASILAQGGIPMIDIQTILRHKNLSTTERYIRRVESIRPALRVLPKLKTTQQPPKMKKALS